ncbi:hypothetical protein [Sulfitobacter geojensis]|uniref:hypothetical protein n=1 Tax=Sulfitobacter geojensis TaxID=1342299 RepID=UPI0024900F3E|nr:hypothetical protein [Sulfitobacter geojensis]
MSIKSVLLASALCASLAACGDTVVEQGIVGTAVGAGAAAVTSGSLLQGAAIGAAGNIAFCQLNPGKCRSVN